MRYKKHIPKKREARFCEICDAPLRKLYKSDERVCGHPKIPGKTQSVCQQMYARKTGATAYRQDTTGRKCGVCKKVMGWMSNANQKYCKRPLYLRRYFVDPRTECEKIAQRKSEDDWRKKNKNGRIPRSTETINYPDHAIEIPEPVFTRRLCLGILSTEELGEHYFMSSGVHNRQCERCKIASDQRKVTAAKYDNAISIAPDRGTIIKRAFSYEGD